MINILPYKQKKMVAQFRFLRTVTATLAAATLLVIAAGALLLPILVSINTRAALANAQMQQLGQQEDVAAAIDAGALANRVQTLVTKLAADPGTAPTAYLATVRRQAGSGITLTGFALTNSAGAVTLRVKGVASTRETLQQFVAALEHTEGIAAVESPVSNYVKHTNSEFLVTVTFQ